MRTAACDISHEEAPYRVGIPKELFRGLEILVTLVCYGLYVVYAQGIYNIHSYRMMEGWGFGSSASLLTS